MNQIIDESDAAIGKQEKELAGVVNDRDILGTQLIRRNDELALLYEKIKIQGPSWRRARSSTRTGSTNSGC